MRRKSSWVWIVGVHGSALDTATGDLVCMGFSADLHMTTTFVNSGRRFDIQGLL